MQVPSILHHVCEASLAEAWPDEVGLDEAGPSEAGPSESISVCFGLGRGSAGTRGMS